jgi:hypothetical protein
MNIIKKIDEKLMNQTYRYLQTLEDKPKLFLFVMIIFFIYVLVAIKMPEPVSEIFEIIKIFIFCVVLYLIILFIYETRAWYQIKRRDPIKAGGRFFPFSVSPIRKWSFFIALTFMFLMIFFPENIKESFNEPSKIKYLIGYNFIYMTATLIVFIEVIRSVSKPEWSNKKHIVILITLFIVFFVLQTILLLISQGLLGSIFLWDIIV